MQQQIALTRMLTLGLLLCGALPLGALAVLSVRTVGQLTLMLIALLAVSIFSVLFSRFIAGRYYAASSTQNSSLDEQILHMEKMASLGRLAADITHELNNPLQLILSQASWIEELLGDEDPGRVKNLDEYQKTLAGIKKQVARATRITGRVLGYARKADEEPTGVQVNALVEETWSFLEKKARDSNISYSQQLGQNLPTTLTNRHQLQQVLLNLMDNALDAMAQNGEVSISTSLDNAYIRIEVSDNGPGISAEMLDRIWNPFVTTKKQGKGTGLGLSISQNIIHSLGGELTAHNRPGGTGAVFTVKIPITPGVATSTKQG